MQVTDGAAKPTQSKNQSSPQSPQLVTLTRAEHLLHNAAQRRGQGEGADQAAVELTKAAAHYAAMKEPPPIKDVLEALSKQFALQSSNCKAEQQVMLGQFLGARTPAPTGSAAPPPPPSAKPTGPPVGLTNEPRAIGWMVRLYRWALAR